jgi:hypothetical protein
MEQNSLPDSGTDQPAVAAPVGAAFNSNTGNSIGSSAGNSAGSQSGIAAADLKVDLRPTLFIGAGGSGMEVLLRIRRRILGAVWNPRQPVRIDAIGEFPVARFLHLDLDGGALIDEGKSQQSDPWFNLVKLGDEEKLVEPFDLAQYHESDDSLARFPLIENWMPLRPKKLRTLGIDPAKGAGQIRAVSRLYLFDQYPKLVNRIKSVLGFLKSNAGNVRKESYQRLGLQIDPSKFRIVVIASCAGGTGAGTALDLGWLSRAIARQEVVASQVDLYLLLPAGYAKANKERTEANAYATLMELETAMRDMNANVRWAEIDSLQGQGAPFDDVYLIDNANLANKATEDMSDVYEMLAEILFEDFASADFANKKRSVAVNQQQHKLGPYNPKVPQERFGAMRLSYAKSYSAIGQAVLDTRQGLRDDIRAYELAGLMVQAFFGLVGRDGAAARRATDFERDGFMREQLVLTESTFDQFPDFKKGTFDVTAFQEYGLVELLLQDKDQRSLLERVEAKVQLEVERIMAGFEIALWREKLAELIPHLERDAIREAGAVAETSEDRIKRHTGVLGQQLQQQARNRLYALLDDRKQGGLAFVLSLLEQIKARLQQRDLPLLEKNAKRYRDIRDALRTRQIEESLGHLSQAAGKLFGKDTQAREVMGHLKRDVADYLRFHLRAVAAHQSAELLGGLSGWLGEVQGVDSAGLAQWSGIAGQLQAGRRSVDAMLQQVKERIGQLREEAKQQHATCIQLGDDSGLTPMAATPDVSAWGEEVLAGLGGSEALFAELAVDESRAVLLSKLFRRARSEITRDAQWSMERGTGRGMGLPGAVALDPLLEKLQGFAPAERQRIFAEWIKSAMPWISSRFSAEFTPRGDQFKCFIGVADPHEWRSMEQELRLAVPGGLLAGDKINIVGTGLPGRAVCYIELSGFPLTVLRGLPGWRSSYQLENPKIPTHLHFDATRFRHPIAPSMDQLQVLADDFEIWLAAVALGILRRKSELPDREARFQPQGQYLLEVEPGEWRQMGNEFAIRANGLPMHYRDLIQSRVQQMQFGPYRTLLQAALMRHYQQQVYRPRLETDETGVQIPAPSLPVISAQRLQQQALQRAAAQLPGVEQAALLAMVERALAQIGQWTEAVSGSSEDCYSWEVEAASAKRVLLVAWARDEALAQGLLAPVAAAAAVAGTLGAAGTSGPAVAAAVPVAPVAAVELELGQPDQSPLPPVRYKVFLQQKQHGPYTLEQIAVLIAQGEIALDTKVWQMGWQPQRDKWQRVAERADLAALFESAIPDPDPDQESDQAIPDPD